MTVVDLAVAIAAGAALAAGAGWCLFAAVRYQRPTWSAPKLTIAVWWVGQLIAWAILVSLFGAIAGAAARAGWLLLGGH